MTSNLGAEHLISGLSGKCTMQVARDRVMQEVARLKMKDVASRLAERGIALAVYGARPIRRWLEKNVVSELAMMYIKEKIDENTTVYIDVGPKGSDLSYRVEKNGEIVNAETGVKSDILIQIPT
ncbi:putative Clp ATPase [Medicago truncatula]|uniref:Putative Clp ATPase n=1 Tax=Medicago truncatula TaxID=3880 RepID=A0A396HAC4_MEDTR|nr:putative Clp ATPase [Medicago truncatula]